MSVQIKLNYRLIISMINKKKLNYIINQIEETNLISFNFLILFLSFSIVPPLKMAR